MIKRTPLKRKPGSLKRSGKIKRKAVDPDRKKEQDEQRERDWCFYREIWSERPHKCQVTGVYLGEELKSIYMDHLLEKANPRYKHLRYEKKNIAVVSGDIHARKDSNPHPGHTQLIEGAMKEFGFSSTGEE